MPEANATSVLTALMRMSLSAAAAPLARGLAARRVLAAPPGPYSSPRAVPAGRDDEPIRRFTAEAQEARRDQLRAGPV